jgi:hypothetical protein
MLRKVNIHQQLACSSGRTQYLYFHLFISVYGQCKKNILLTKSYILLTCIASQMKKNIFGFTFFLCLLPQYFQKFISRKAARIQASVQFYIYKFANINSILKFHICNFSTVNFLAKFFICNFSTTNFLTKFHIWHNLQ